MRYSYTRWMAICGNCFHLYIVVTKSIQLTSDDLNTIKIYLWKVENMDVCREASRGPHIPLARSEPCSGGAGAGVLSYRDTLKHILWRSILGFLPRTVPVRQYPHPSFNLSAVHLSETINLLFTHRGEGVRYLTSGP